MALTLAFLIMLLLTGSRPARSQPLELSTPPPETTEAHLKFAENALRAGLPLEAAREYRAVLRVRPADAAAHFALAGALEAGHRPGEAEIEYRETIRLQPGNAPAHNALAGLLEDRGETAAALAQYRQALALEPGNPRLHFNLGAALEEAGQKADAQAEYRAALRLAPDFAEARAALASSPTPAFLPLPAPKTDPDTLARAGRLPEAIAAFRSQMAREPQNAIARLHLGIALYAQGQTALARQEWTRVQTQGSAPAAAQARRLLAAYR